MLAGSTSAFTSRRSVLRGAASIVTASAAGSLVSVGTAAHADTSMAAKHTGARGMSTVTTRDGTDIFYKDWGPRDAQAIVFHHGWPLSADDWDNQMLYFLSKGYRVIAHDRRALVTSSPAASTRAFALEEGSRRI
jgi:non-heme chloroperoxidase